MFDLMFFSHLPLFRGIPENRLDSVLSVLQARTASFERGNFIRREGDPADFIGLLLEGQLQIIQDDWDGVRNIISVVEPSGLFAEAFACAGIAHLPVSILAAVKCTALFIPREAILHPVSPMLPELTAITANLMFLLANKNILINQKLRCLSRRTTADKLMSYLRDQARLNNSTTFTIPLNRQGLADYLGVERSAMCAEISKLQRVGKLRTHLNTFELL